MERGRPIYEFLYVSLEALKDVKLSSDIINALLIAYRLTGMDEYLERARKGAVKLAKNILEGRELENDLSSLAHAFRLILQVDGQGLDDVKNALSKMVEYAFRTKPVDLQILRVLLEEFRRSGKEEILSKMREMVEQLPQEEKAKGLLILYGATRKSEYFERAVEELGRKGLSESDVAVSCWELCGFEVDVYPKDEKARDMIFESLNFYDEGMWRRFSAFLGELKVREEERGRIVKEPLEVSSKLRVLEDPVGEGVVLGRSRDKLQTFGAKGLMYIGCICERAEENNFLGKPVLVDALKPHVIFICGQRGSGKSYTMGVLAEELARSGLGLAVVIVDPVGIFWSMKYPNREEKEVEELRRWGLKPRGFTNIRVLVPLGVYDKLPDATRDMAFSIKPSDLTVDDWCYAFGVERFGAMGLLLERALIQVREGYEAVEGDEKIRVEGKRDEYTIDDMIKCVETSLELLSKDRGFRTDTRRAVISRLLSAKEWGIFSREGTPLDQIAVPNMVTVVDVSYLTEGLRGLVVGLLARKILEKRMQLARREEGLQFGSVGAIKEEIPVTWLMVDEAHILAPARGETAASGPLIEYAKLGRKPGCALVLATQQPSATSDQILSQVDMIITHYLTFEADIEAFMRRSPNKVPQEMSRDFIRRIPIGMALISDASIDTGRVLAVKIRPRQSQHAGREAIPGLARPGSASLLEEGRSEEVTSLIPEKIGEKVEVKMDESGVGMVGGEERVGVAKKRIPILDVSDDLAGDYLSRLIKYRFNEYLYPSSKIQGVNFQKALRVDPEKMLSTLREKLTLQGWELTCLEGDALVFLGQKGNVRIGFSLAWTNTASVIAFEVTAPSKGEAMTAKELIENILQEISREGGWIPPPKVKVERRKGKEEKEMKAVSMMVREKPSVDESAERGKVEVKASAEGETRLGRELAREGMSDEEIISKIGRIQKYLRSLHEYYLLGRMTEEEYSFLRKKAFKKIEELRRMLGSG